MPYVELKSMQKGLARAITRRYDMQAVKECNWKNYCHLWKRSEGNRTLTACGRKLSPAATQGTMLCEYCMNIAVKELKDEPDTV